MNKKEKLSIIIPVLNEEKNLSRLLPRLREQKGVEIEIIVADAGSTDNSKKICRKYKAKITKGGLPAIGRNRGAEIASNERILFLDADVYFSKIFIIKCIKNMKKKKLVLASVLTDPESDKKIDRLMFFFWDNWVFLTQKFYPHAPGYCIFSSKKLHEKINGFDEKLTLADDSNYVFRGSKFARFGIIPLRIKTSVRRLDTEGRFKLAIKMIGCALYRIFFGEAKKNQFNYNFGEHKR